jgi:carbon monoxide dehydrogenase subunit G
VKVEGTRSFDAPRGTVWAVLNDPESMAKLMPGVESFEIQDERRWKANVKIPLGLGGLRMSINFEKTDERELEYAALSAKGTGVGALMNMQTQFHLADGDGGGTSMRWEADVRIAGPVGSMGQRVLQPIVNQQVQSVLTALDEQVAGASGSCSSRWSRSTRCSTRHGSWTRPGWTRSGSPRRTRGGGSTGWRPARRPSCRR